MQLPSFPGSTSGKLELIHASEMTSRRSNENLH
jgi:hypothetical protein